MDLVGLDAIAIPSLWPHSSCSYNASAKKYAEVMEVRFLGDPQVTLWLWDRRQPMANYDGVHLQPKGYLKAVTYLVSVIVWVIHHNQW